MIHVHNRPLVALLLFGAGMAFAYTGLNYANEVIRKSRIRRELREAKKRIRDKLGQTDTNTESSAVENSSQASNNQVVKRYVVTATKPIIATSAPMITVSNDEGVVKEPKDSLWLPDSKRAETESQSISKSAKTTLKSNRAETDNDDDILCTALDDPDFGRASDRFTTYADFERNTKRRTTASKERPSSTKQFFSKHSHRRYGYGNENSRPSWKK